MASAIVSCPGPSDLPLPSTPLTDLSSDLSPRRITFRRRLVISQGLVLSIAFLIIGILSWLATYGWLHYHAWTLLEREAVEINFHIVGLDGGLAPERYSWHEPHHLYREKRVDPYFAQIFDTQGAIVYASGNTRLFTTPFPDSLIAYHPSAIGAIRALNILKIDGEALYFGTYPVLGRNEQPIGYLQIARYEPDIPGQLREFATGLSLGLIALLAILLIVTDRVASRVLSPLQSITRVADALSPTRMDERIPIPADADWETTRLAETLNALLGRLESAFENMRRFTANAAHELQTPLTVLRGQVDVSLRRPRTAESYAETLRTLIGEIDGMSRTIRGLLTLTRLERDRAMVGDSAFNLADLISEEAAFFSRRAREKGLVWTEHVDASLPVCGYIDLLRDALRNVLENAVKFTLSGRIELTASARDNRITLAIADTGIGIESAALPFVTERFFRADTTADIVSGSGLGLSLVDQIIAMHGGSIEITSEPAVGTTVRLHLPMASDTARHPGKRPPAETHLIS